jgi:DNA repair protein RadA/Sms
MTTQGVITTGDALVKALEPKTRVVFQCDDCMYRCRDFRNQCGSCGGYNTLREKELALSSHVHNAIDGEDVTNVPAAFGTPQRLSDVAKNAPEPDRIEIGIPDVDYVLGTNAINGKTGAVKGTALVIGGDPGVGKSTLMTQILGRLALLGKVYYGSGEEAVEAVGVRANRLGIFSDPIVEENFIVQATKSTPEAVAWIRANRPIAAVIDSAQVFTSSTVNGQAGGNNQVEANAQALFTVAHDTGTIVFIICHVKKDGEFAGPQRMMHFVDVSLMLKHHDGGTIMLSSDKNRYGDISLCGLLKMNGAGLNSVNA